jgi:putative transposase
MGISRAAGHSTRRAHHRSNEGIMSRNFYSEVNLHIVWHTKDSLPLLTPSVEPMAHQALRRKLVETPGAFVHEIGGVENHVHLCITILPTTVISELIGQLKGGSSYEVNHRLGHRHKLLEWQDGYGVVSFGTRDLDWVKAYIRDQRQHHAAGTTHDRLERWLKPDHEKPHEWGSN